MKTIERFLTFLRSIFHRKKSEPKDKDLEERMKKARKNDPFIYR